MLSKGSYDALSRHPYCALQEELLAVIAKYIPVDKENIKVSMERRGDFEVLELNVLFPDQR